ncbi:MAG: universal stress protein [Desulfurococcaceae archaeon]
MSEGPTYTVSLYFRKILVPVDGSESSFKALVFAIDLARHYGSKITILYARPKGTHDDLLEKVKYRLRGEGIQVSYKLLEYDYMSESASSAILKEIIEGGYDAVILGARGRSLITDIPVGSVALSLVVSAPISVFVVR